jgi:hypothetical protein
VLSTYRGFRHVAVNDSAGGVMPQPDFTRKTPMIQG